MMITTFSLIMAVVWFSLLIVVGDILVRKIGFLKRYNVSLLLFFIGLSVTRLFIPVEFTHTLVINSKAMLPSIERFLISDFTGLNLSLLGAFLALWSLGSLFCFARIVSHTLHDNRTVKLLHLSKMESVMVSSVMEQILMGSKSRRQFRIVVSPFVSTPMVTGYFHSTILLPQMVLGLSEEQLHNILLHEWHHILAYDSWVKIFVEFVCCMVWWNPVVYLLRKTVTQSLEIRCDIAVTRSMNKKAKASYLRTMMEVLGSLTPVVNSSPQSVIFANSKYTDSAKAFSIRQRFLVVIYYCKPNIKKTIAYIGSMIVLFALSYFVVFQPAYIAPNGSNPLTAENSYLILTTDNQYELYVDGDCIQIFTNESMDADVLATMKVYKEER